MSSTMTFVKADILSIVSRIVFSVFCHKIETVEIVGKHH